MDSAAVILGHPLRFRLPSSSYPPGEFKTSSKMVVMARPRRIGDELILSSQFYEQGHLLYYNSNHPGRSSTLVMSRNQENAQKKRKKQLKLLKKLSRDLSKISHKGFGLNSVGTFVDGGKGSAKTSVDHAQEMPELLLERDQKLRKKTKKEKAARTNYRPVDCASSSSSSSSESSSDGECGNFISMKNIKPAQATHINSSKQIDGKMTTTSSSCQCPSKEERVAPVFPTTPAKMGLENQSSGIGACGACDRSCTKKIEVCMGGSCRRSGAEALLEKFRQSAGIESAVSDCKCMGRCRNGPNVRVLNGSNVIALHTGVGLEDVDIIADNLSRS